MMGWGGEEEEAWSQGAAGGDSIILALDGLAPLLHKTKQKKKKNLGWRARRGEGARVSCTPLFPGSLSSFFPGASLCQEMSGDFSHLSLHRTLPFSHHVNGPI